METWWPTMWCRDCDTPAARLGQWAGRRETRAPARGWPPANAPTCRPGWSRHAASNRLARAANQLGPRHTGLPRTHAARHAVAHRAVARRPRTRSRARDLPGDRRARRPVATIAAGPAYGQAA